MSLTIQQQRAFDFIKKYTSEHGGVPPTFTEIANAVGLRAKSGVARLVDGLQERGFIRRRARRERSIEIVDRTKPNHVLSFEVEKRLDAYCKANDRDRGSVLNECVMCWLDVLSEEAARNE